MVIDPPDTAKPPDPVEIEISACVASPARATMAVPEEFSVSPHETASTRFLFAGTAAPAGAVFTTDINPNPKAETATSAMRLRVVFVDICFLSLVDPEYFPRSAW
jgi:hypothetical protein